MALAGSLQLSHDLGLCKNQGFRKQFKNVMGRGNPHLLSATLTSRTLIWPQNSQRFNLSGCPYRQIHSIPYRSNTIRCHFSPLPGQACQLPCVKAASMAITNSFSLSSDLEAYNRILGSIIGCTIGLRLRHINDMYNGSGTAKLDVLVDKTVHASNQFNQHRSFHYIDLGGHLKVDEIDFEMASSAWSYNALQNSPLVLKLVPAVAIIVFAVWGLGPLMCQSRNLLLHKNDSSWKKSRTHYVMTSYIQPLLLWTGAILICRALDPVVLPTEASQIVKQRLLNFIRSLSTVLAFAYCLSSMIRQAQKFFMETTDSSDTRNMGFQFAGKAIYSAVWVASASLFMELLGFSTQRWLTAGGLGTVLLTLAGREIFTNFLSSAMIHATRPFVVNEWIQTKIEGYEVSGTVEHVGWWSPTIVRGEDREAVHIPNHKFTVNVVRNLSQKTHWRIKTHLAISHLDVQKINNIVADMRKVLAKNPQVEQQKLHRRVFLDNINPENQALLILVSCFVKTSHHEEYLCVKEAILLDLLRVISHHRARLATPIRTVQKIFTDAELENIPYADPIYNRGGVASNRPLLLIEPSYRINGEDKLKSQNRSSRSSGEQDGKATPRPTPDNKADSRVGGTPRSGSKADTKITEGSNSDTREEFDPKVANKVTVKSALKSVPKTNSKVAEISSSESKVQGSASHNSNKDRKISDSKQPKIVGQGNATQYSKIDNPPVSSLETGTEKAGGLLESKQEGDKLPSPQPPMSRPHLEDNIVLGVALEGSKRTLPIEEGMASPQPAEVKELTTASRNGHGSSTAEKERKDGQISATPSPTSGVSDKLG